VVDGISPAGLPLVGVETGGESLGCDDGRPKGTETRPRQRRTSALGNIPTRMLQIHQVLPSLLIHGRGQLLGRRVRPRARVGDIRPCDRRHGPVREVHVDVVEAHVFEDQVEAFGDVGRVCEVGPEFGGDEDFGARDAGFADCGADF